MPLKPNRPRDDATQPQFPGDATPHRSQELADGAATRISGSTAQHTGSASAETPMNTVCNLEVVV
jgi:hypothetical protein